MNINKNTKMNLERATQIMYEEFGFKPEKSKLIYYDLDKWVKFRKRTGNEFFDPWGIYEFQTLKAHVPENAPLFILIHEYLGHGSFYEYSKIGKKKISIYQTLKKLHSELFNERLGYDILRKVGIDEKVSNLPNKKRKGKNFQKKLLIYRGQAAKMIKICDNTREKSEGFAVWLENYLMGKIGCNKNKRPKKGDATCYLSYFKKLKNYEKRYGIERMLKYVGFEK